MTSTVKKLPDSKVELTIGLDKKELLLFTERVEEELARGMKLEGFRPGKAPRNLVRKEMGEDKIREEALKAAIQSSLKDALAKEDLDIIDQLDLKVKENSADKLVYQTIFLIFPEVILGEYKGLGIKRNAVNVTRRDIEEVLESVQKSRTVFSEAKRPAQRGDKVEIDFTLKHQGAVIEGGRSENHPIIIGDGRFVPGFEEQLIGMRTGETKRFSLRIPDDYYQKTIAGKEIDFEVAMKKVEDRIVPKLNDDFAKGLGSFSSLGELEASVKQGLTMEKEIKERDRTRLAILEKISSTTKTEVPPALVENRLDAMVRDLDGELHQKGMELGLYLAKIKKTQDELRRDWRVQAESQAKSGLIIRAIARAEKLKVSEEEANNELQIVLQQYVINSQGGTGPEALQNIDPEKLKSRIRDTLLNEKVFEFLEKQNTV